MTIIIIIVDFAVPADHRIKLKESEKKDESDAYTNYNLCSLCSHQRINKET